MEMTPAQAAAVARFSNQRVAALFMEMGTGKTFTALNLANFHADKYDLVLWLAPVSTIENARREINDRGGFKKPVIYRGYESIAMSSKIYLNLSRELEGKRIFLICDESLYLKNGESKRWQRSNEIRKRFADFCILLNGTPMTRDEMDIYWQMRFLSPKILNMTEAEYRSTLFTKIKYDGRQAYYKRCQKNIPWLKSRIAPYVYECDLSISATVDERAEEYRLSNYIKEQYDEVKQELLDAIKRSSNDEIVMGYLVKLKCLVASDRMKNDAIAEHASNRKVVVFTEHREEQERIVSQIKNGALVINGDTPLVERDKIIQEWSASSNKPLVIMTKCGGFGLNLQTASEVVFASLPWDYASYMQALHRVYRIGQQSSVVTVTRCTQRIGISRMIEDCLWKKTSLAEYVKSVDWKNMNL